jgi:hypothetical protein
MLRPMPRAPPVMMAVRPAKSYLAQVAVSRDVTCARFESARVPQCGVDVDVGDDDA